MIVLDDMIADMHSIKKLNPMVTELFIRGKKLKTFDLPKNIRTNSTHFFVIKIPIKSHLIIYQILTFKTLRIFGKEYKN